ncbi:MAG: hypothetical protein BRD57_04035 [Proteobacteria bacterium SW_6_67_9]|jgi:sensor domain CHASE-containing protein|nr:MAG: hypothetical protein BRD57_04035 [Proteobacteria bacterium SW_6_67_9]
MSSEILLAIIAALVVVVVVVIAWGLLGPRRASDEAGPHVDLAERTRQRDQARQAGFDPDRPRETDDSSD